MNHKMNGVNSLIFAALCEIKETDCCVEYKCAKLKICKGWQQDLHFPNPVVLPKLKNAKPFFINFSI